MKYKQWLAFWKWLLEDVQALMLPIDNNIFLDEYLKIKKSIFEARFQKSIPLAELTNIGDKEK